MNITEAKQAANNAGNGSEDDLRSVLFYLIERSGSGAVVASGTQADAIADPTGGSTEDAEARAAINNLIDACQAFGIVGTS